MEMRMSFEEFDRFVELIESFREGEVVIILTTDEQVGNLEKSGFPKIRSKR